MNDDGSTAQQGAIWPLPKFYFRVSFGDVEMSFQEVSGLDVEAQPLEYRHGDSPSFSVIKMPGLKKFSDVTMKKGTCPAGTELWAWINAVKMNTVKRQKVTIALLDEAGAPTMVWTLANAFPTKITSTDLKSSGNEVAIETLVLAHEGLTIANA